jgi:hypothetical protein
MLRKKIKQLTVTAVAVAIFVAVGTGRVSAHHGWSEYDNNQTLNLTGKIQNVGYDYPHVTIQVASDDRQWLAVLAPPSRMQRRGLPPEALKVGATVRLVGYPHRGESNEMRAEQITIGKQTVELR